MRYIVLRDTIIAEGAQHFYRGTYIFVRHLQWTRP